MKLPPLVRAVFCQSELRKKKLPPLVRFFFWPGPNLQKETSAPGLLGFLSGSIKCRRNETSTPGSLVFFVRATEKNSTPGSLVLFVQSEPAERNFRPWFAWFFVWPNKITREKIEAAPVQNALQQSSDHNPCCIVTSSFRWPQVTQSTSSAVVRCRAWLRGPRVQNIGNRWGAAISEALDLPGSSVPGVRVRTAGARERRAPTCTGHPCCPNAKLPQCTVADYGWLLHRLASRSIYDAHGTKPPPTEPSPRVAASTAGRLPQCAAQMAWGLCYLWPGPGSFLTHKAFAICGLNLEVLWSFATSWTDVTAVTHLKQKLHIWIESAMVL